MGITIVKGRKTEHSFFKQKYSFKPSLMIFSLILTNTFWRFISCQINAITMELHCNDSSLKSHFSLKTIGQIEEKIYKLNYDCIVFLVIWVEYELIKINVSLPRISNLFFFSQFKFLFYYLTSEVIGGHEIYIYIFFWYIQ